MARYQPMPEPRAHEERASEDGAVHGYQRQEDAERGIKRGKELLHDHLDHLGEGGDDGDEQDEAEEAQVDACELVAEPGQRAGLEDELVEEIVQGKRDEQHGDHGDAEAVGRLHIL